jgi:phage terminase large subunit
MNEINITLQPKQKEAFIKSLKTPITFYGGARGGGKSFLVRAREVYRRLKHPKTQGLIVRKTYPELLSNHIRQFFVEYPQTRAWYNKGEKAIYWPNGSVTEFSHLSSTDDVYSYQGREYADISVDEAGQHEEEVIKVLRASLRTSNPTIKPTMLLTGNPGGIGHQWLKRIFVDRNFGEYENPDDYDFVQAKVYDNLALMKADPAYIGRLQALPEDKRRAYLDGDWDVFSGQVFSEWRRDTHLLRGFYPRKDNPIFLSFDWGYNAPFACYAHLLLDLKTEGGKPFKRVITFREWYGKERHPQEWAEIIYRDLEGFKVLGAYCDPAMFNRKSDGSISISDEFTNQWDALNSGYWIGLDRGSNDRIKGWAIMHRWLSTAPDGIPFWQVTDRCENLVRTLPFLVYDEHRVEDLDTTQEDHAADACRYLLSSLSYVPEGIGGVLSIQETKRIVTVLDSHGGATQDDDIGLAFQDEAERSLQDMY